MVETTYSLQPSHVKVFCFFSLEVFDGVFVSAVKLTEEVDVEADVFYPITCGDAKATLVWKKFVCPGINVKCVQVCTVIL